MRQNQHEAAIPAEVLKEMQIKVNEINELLSPYAVALTPKQRHDMPKMGPKSFSFVEKAYDFAVQNPNLRPPFLDMGDFEADFKDAHGLWTIQNSIEQLNEIFSDTILESGSEAYQSALVFYNSVKIAAAQDIPGAKAVFETLRARFPHGKHHPSGQSSDE